MKRALITSVTALSIMGGSQALAQTAVLQISPEQRTTIREYVVKEKVKPVTVREKIVVGSALPGDVTLVAVPSIWGPSFVKYHYVYSDNRVVLVDPSSRKVIQIIE